MKNKKLGKKIISVLCTVFAAAVLVSGLVLYTLYDTALKPAVFENLVAPPTGDGTGYYRHCYYELTGEEQTLYTVILDSIYDMPERIEIPKLNEANLDRLFTALSYDNPDLFFLGSNCKVYNEGLKTYFEPAYAITKQEYEEQLGELETVASVIVKGAEAYSSLYEKELYIHDYIVTNCVYTAPESYPYANSVYGCLVRGKAGCEGYSRAFQYLLNTLNIDNRLVTGESAEDGENYVGHMWNYVTLNGKGYFVDVTWDDPKTATQVLRHTFFNVTTNDILIDHRDIVQTLPLCTDTEYNYFVYENAYIFNTDSQQLEMAVENALYNARQRNYKCVELRFADADALRQAKESLFDTGIVYTIYRDAGLLNDLSGAKVYYSMYENMNSICIFF